MTASAMAISFESGHVGGAEMAPDPQQADTAVAPSIIRELTPRR
jgi:hypothetical protein